MGVFCRICNGKMYPMLKTRCLLRVLRFNAAFQAVLAYSFYPPALVHSYAMRPRRRVITRIRAALILIDQPGPCRNIRIQQMFAPDMDG